MFGSWIFENQAASAAGGYYRVYRVAHRLQDVLCVLDRSHYLPRKLLSHLCRFHRDKRGPCPVGNHLVFSEEVCTDGLELAAHVTCFMGVGSVSLELNSVAPLQFKAGWHHSWSKPRKKAKLTLSPKNLRIHVQNALKYPCPTYKCSSGMWLAPCMK